jgi:FtsP/CotA-like multicopper oxidase with cupredoxin domain
LLNGIGDVTQFGNKNTSPVPEPYTLIFEKTSPRPKRYLLRLINTSIGSTFVFSVDNHLLSIVSADFVPIYPYMNTSLLIGIGQRYNVIVEANPRANGSAQPIQDDGNYWIRTWLADKCGPGVDGNASNSYMKTGILRYDNTSKAKPQSSPWNDISMACSDETYTSLRPVVPWIVGYPINGVDRAPYVQNVSIVRPGSSKPPYPDATFAFRNSTDDASAFFPLQINFSSPTFLDLDGTKPWGPLWEVYPEGRTNQTDWVSNVSAAGFLTIV